MCVVSAVGDYYGRGWPPPYDLGWYKSWPSTSVAPFEPPYSGPTKEQFEEFLELLRAAKKIDKATNQPDCETAEKFSGFEKFLTAEQMAKLREILSL
jgi:hypothetical protein